MKTNKRQLGRALQEALQQHYSTDLPPGVEVFVAVQVFSMGFVCVESLLNEHSDRRQIFMRVEIREQNPTEWVAAKMLRNIRRGRDPLEATPTDTKGATE